MSEYHSRVYTDRPAYADFDAPAKFEAIKSIIAKRLYEHPNAICSYSGGSDSDIMIDLIERTRQTMGLPPVKYCFFNTGLEMKATKDHVKYVAEKYGVEITEERPKINIVLAARRYGIPFVSKIMSAGLSEWQKKGVPLSIADEYEQAEDKKTKRQELRERYPKCESLINFLCCCNASGEPRPNIQLVINSSLYMRDFIAENPPTFQISAKCCDYCKKQLAHRVQKYYEMIITGERRDEGGMRSVPRKDNTSLCFTETSSGQYRLRPLYYVSDEDKAWYKVRHKVRYSDAYEVYGLTRTGCCGCPISYKAVDDLEKIGRYEPNITKAAWNIFGDSYRYSSGADDHRGLFGHGGRRMNSKAKGGRGEREWATFCRDHGFTEARRGQQFSGGADSPDVLGLPGIHQEVKRVENLNIHKAMEQSVRDCEGKAMPIVAHRRNREGWLVTMRAEDWMEVYKGWLNGECSPKR